MLKEIKKINRFQIKTSITADTLARKMSHESTSKVKKGVTGSVAETTHNLELRENKKSRAAVAVTREKKT